MARLTRLILLAAIALLAVPGHAAAASKHHHHRHHHHRVASRRVASAPSAAHRAAATDEEGSEEPCIRYEADGTCVVGEWVTTPAERAEMAAEEARTVCLKWEGDQCVESEFPETPGTLTEAEAAEVARITEEEGG